MSLLFPRFAYAPMRCGPIRREVAPLWSLFDDTFNEIASRQARRPFQPRFDVKETKESYSLTGELPGIDQKNLSVEFIDEHTLTIKGHTETVKESGSKPEAVEAAEPTAEATTTPETASVKSHQATVEDEEPATTATEETPAESSEVAKTAAPEAPAKAEEPKQHNWISERHYGQFSRSFSFPSRIDQEAVKASLKDGILSIVVPKLAAPESRRINVE